MFDSIIVQMLKDNLQDKVASSGGSMFLLHLNKRCFNGQFLDKPARLIIGLLFGFVSDSVFVKLNKNQNKY